MQQTGIETLQHVASSLGGLGRYGDTYMIHAAEGETVIPMEILDRDPLLKERLFDSMRAMGVDPERYIVGNELNSLNPLTGQPEFFFKSIKKLFKSPVAQVLAGMFLPGGALIPMGMEALAGGEMKDIFHAGVRGTGGRMGADWLAGTSMGGDILPKYMGERTNWWDAVAKGAWGKEVPAKTMSEFEKTQLMKGYLAEAAQKKLVGTEAVNYALKAIADKEAAFNLANAGTKAGWLNKMGSTLMEDPLKTLFVTGMGYGQYDEAKRFNEALKQQQEEGDSYQYDVNYDVIDDVLGTTTPITYPSPVTPVAKGGIMQAYPRKQGGISGPGSGTSDDIPAMLSDGEFVMTADAVKGAGGGSRSAGTKKMYDMMRQFEGKRA